MPHFLMKKLLLYVGHFPTDKMGNGVWRKDPVKFYMCCLPVTLNRTPFPEEQWGRSEGSVRWYWRVIYATVFGMQTS